MPNRDEPIIIHPDRFPWQRRLEDTIDLAIRGALEELEVESRTGNVPDATVDEIVRRRMHAIQQALPLQGLSVDDLVTIEAAFAFVIYRMFAVLLRRGRRQ